MLLHLVPFLPHIGRTLMPSQRSFVGEGSLADLAQFPPLSLCLSSVFIASDLSFTPVLLLPPAYAPRSVAAWLAPFFHRFLSLSSRRTPAPATCIPVSHRLHCLHVFPGLSLVSSSLTWAANQVCFRPSRRAPSPFSLLGKGRPSHFGILHL